ncbi:MAG: FtsQ-type POTRA domain-containing protein [Oscillospiraceae bacterium]|nr:FtsQ-type POTRA domain-containing protein [Oscillospiraceae bacterium]
MARKRGSGRRHRRNRFGFLYKLLSALVICAVVVVALTMFFRVGTIRVEGNSRYTDQEVIDASGMAVGDNLILLNKHALALRLTEQLPYIEAVYPHRRLPDTLVIDVTECGVTFALQGEGTYWLMSDTGKIVDTAAEPGDRPVIDGCGLLAPSVGTQIALPTEQQLQGESLLALLKALRTADAMEQVDAIHLDSAAEIVMDYAGRFAVKMPYGADYDKMLSFLTIVMDTLETNETGVIDLTTEGKASVLKQ